MRGRLVSKDSVKYLTQDPEKLNYLRSRTPFHRFSENEYLRRWDKMRKFMRSHQIQCMLISGGNSGWLKGWSNVRYVSEYIGSQESNCFVVFPLEGDPAICGVGPTYAHRLYRSIIDDLRAGPSAILAAHRITELGLESTKIGIVEHTSMLPRNVWEGLQVKLPRAKFEFVSKEWWDEVRFPLSTEEEEWMKRSGKIGDQCLEAIAGKMRPGMTEDELFATSTGTAIANGGEHEYMSLIGSHSMLDPDADDTSATPRDRVLRKGDIILTEIGPEYNGYETQCGWPITLGKPTKEYDQMFAVAFEVYQKVVGLLKEGCDTDKILEAGDLIDEKGYKCAGPPLLHALPSGLSGNDLFVPQRGQLESFIMMGRTIKKMELRAGVPVSVGVSVARRDELAGLYIGDSFIIRKGPPSRLHSYPTQMTQI
ncbi:MAG: M24 family metallopeptidase [Nitrososphaerales archaeon]